MGVDRFSLTTSDSQSRGAHNKVAGQEVLPTLLLLLLKFFRVNFCLCRVLKLVKKTFYILA